MAKDTTTVVRKDGNARATAETTKRFWALDNEGQIHWGATAAEAARAATEANMSLRENH